MFYMFLLVLDLGFWDVYYNFIPYMGEVILTSALVKGGLVDTDVYRFLDGPGKGMPQSFILKLSMVVGLPVVDCGHVWVRRTWDVPYIPLQMFYQIPLYICHCSPAYNIWASI